MALTKHLDTLPNDDTVFLNGKGKFTAPLGAGPHAITHQSGGSDPLSLSSIAGAITASQHGTVQRCTLTGQYMKIIADGYITGTSGTIISSSSLLSGNKGAILILQGRLNHNADTYLYLQMGYGSGSWDTNVSKYHNVLHYAGNSTGVITNNGSYAGILCGFNTWSGDSYFGSEINIRPSTIITLPRAFSGTMGVVKVSDTSKIYSGMLGGAWLDDVTGLTGLRLLWTGTGMQVHYTLGVYTQ